MSGRRRLRAKLLAVLLGLLCAGLLLELGVRLAGVSFLRRQARRNDVALNHPGAYRILCLGDSMTAGNYPRFIEEDLNERAGGGRFAVIDEARPATTSRDTLAALPAHLAKYRPDMVVVMMGANDPSGPLPYGEVQADRKPVLKSVRLGQFLRYLVARQWRRRDPAWAGPPPGPPAPAALGSPALTGASPQVLSGRRLLHEGRANAAIASFDEALKSSPEDPDALSGLAECYEALGKSELAGKLFRRAATELFARASRTGEKRPLYDALLRLGWSYRESRQHGLAVATFKRAIALYPRSGEAYAELGVTLVRRGKPRDATAMFERAAELDPGMGAPYMMLGVHYLGLRDYPNAERAYQKALSRNPNLDQAYGGLATCYALTGRPGLEKEYLDKANALRESSYVAMTRDNYRALHELVRRSGAKLVCVQYPRRSLAALKKLFADPSGILFVDNEGPFNQALRGAPATDLFVDFYAGDFGHCTDWGYRLLAKDIADVIWEEGFGK